MFSATSHIELELLTKFVSMSKFQYRLSLVYQRLPLQIIAVTNNNQRKFSINQTFSLE